MQNVKEQIERRPIKIVSQELRPPSRHRTPPKAMGLDLPPPKQFSSFINVENMYGSMASFNLNLEDEPDDPLALTMPTKMESQQSPSNQRYLNSGEVNLNFQKSLFESEEEKKRGISFNKKKRNETPQQKSKELNCRAWSASQQNKQNIPVVLNKREKIKKELPITRRRTSSKVSEREDKTPGKPNQRNSYRGIDPAKNLRANRAKSSSNRNKISQTLPFYSSLEPEFLDLFAKVK